MTQKATVFFVDLEGRAKKLQPALAAMGFEVGLGPVDQLNDALRIATPAAIVGPAESMSAIAERLSPFTDSRHVPLFALAQDPEAHKRPGALPKEVTAVLPEDIDGGVLGLRLRALVPSGERHGRQATLVGISTPPARPMSAPPAPPAALRPQAEATPSALLTQKPALSSPPHTSPTYSENSTTKIAPTSATAASAIPPPSSVQSSGPVAFSVTPGDEDIPTSAHGAPNKKRFYVAAAAALAVAGAFALTLGSKTEPEKTASETAAATQAKPTSQENPSPAKHTRRPQADTSAPSPVEKPQEVEPQEPPSLSKDPDAPWFRIEEQTKLQSCEETLGKSADDFKETVSWKAAQAWKLARKSLMAGKQAQAAKQMCESAFINPKGPAIQGLINYYLSQRALNEAHYWAQKAVEHNPKSRSAQEALGDVLNQMGQVQEARQIWLETFKLTADQKDRLAAVSRSLVKSAVKARRGGDAPLAERLLRRALSFQPKDAWGASQFASVLLKNDQKDLAKKWAQRALEVDPKSKLAKNVLSKLS